jgi:hypothetical protein
MATPVDSIEVFRNRDLTIKVTIRNASVGDIDGSKLWFSVKSSIDTEDASAVIYKRNTAAGGGPTEAEILDGPNREVAFYIDKSDTVNQTSGMYITDAVIELLSGKRYQLLIPRQFAIKEPVTKTPDP